jgi:TonB family protein
MINYQHNRQILFLLATALVWVGGKAYAQENVPGPKRLPIVVDHKQAAGLIVAQPAPEYPAVAKINFIQGQVLLELVVSRAGRVARAHVLEGNALLAASALSAAAQWIYRPLSTPAGPSGFITTVKLKFTLDDQQQLIPPRKAEQDFLRQVKPPQMVQAPDAAPDDVVHMRLLVNEQGQVVDVEGTRMDKNQLQAEQGPLPGWTFRPAHWGSLPVPSYVEIERTR